MELRSGSNPQTGKSPGSNPETVASESNSRNSGDGNDGRLQNVLQVEKFEPTTQSWKRWRQRLEGAFYLFKITDEKEKTAYLLHYIGVKPFEILCDRLEPENPYTKSYAELCGKIEEFYVPEPLEIAEIFTFRKCTQKDGETAQEFMAEL